MSKLPSMLTAQVILDGLRYIVKGGLVVKNSHLPVSNHPIPDHFIGICVATNQQAATDDYVMQQLVALGIGRVRLDVGDDDMYPHQTRLLRRLLDAHMLVDVHLVQPFAMAKQMADANVSARWYQFVQAFLHTYGEEIASLEIGNTINRKRWSGYDWSGFMAAWQIAFRLAKAANVTVIGPNIQDFEPLYNVHALGLLQINDCLPNMQSNNLFVERVIEPEQADYRIFKFRWTRIFKFNLIKKARLLQKIGADYGVPALVSPVAFWAIYRIQRHLPNGAQKQADYVIRYFTLLAASGALKQANWGAMICHREGVINDGLDDARYPALERVAYYRAADGNLADYQRNPSFMALRTVVRWVNGAHYIGALVTGAGLEIHQLQKHQKRIHIAWTTNGHSAVLAEIYAEYTLRNAEYMNGRGVNIDQPNLITEAPIYLIWDVAHSIELHVSNPVLSGTIVHAHISHQQYFPVHEGDWRGMILADTPQQAAMIMNTLHPAQLMAPDKQAALRHARNVIWSMPDPRDDRQKITVKQPVKMHVHKRYLDQFKPSKAKRSWNGAMQLMRRGIDTAVPLAYFEKVGDHSLKQNFFICAFVQHDFTIAQAFMAFRDGASQYQGVTTEHLYASFAAFCRKMHSSGIYFRDFSGGNILVTNHSGELQFALIDTARLRAYSTATPHGQRLADLTRALNKLHWPGRKAFLSLYFATPQQQLRITTLLPFYLYDFKVKLKRTIGRKGIKKALRFIKSRIPSAKT